MRRSRVGLLVLGLSLALLTGLLPAATASAGTPLPVPTARGSVNQVQVTGATPGATVELLHDGTPTGAHGVADTQGSFIFGVQYGPADDVAAGSGYAVRQVGGSPSAAVTVT